MKKFDFKEIDEEGLQTLETIADAHRFNRWMYETVARHIQPGSILEIGSGIGNISHFFLEDGRDIVQSDIRALYCQFLARTYGAHPHCREVLQLDLVHPHFQQEYRDQLGQYDNVYALNVVEHIEDDAQALANCAQLLKPGGKLIILVPAFQWLYNGFDEELFHFRRYTARQMAARFVKQGLKVRKRFYFNCMGILGWYVSGKLQRHRSIPDGQMQFYNRLVPIFRWIDRLVGRKIGLSVVVVGKKEADSQESPQG